MDENDRGIKLGIPRMNSLIVFLSILLFCEVTYGQQNRANSVPVKKNILVLNSYHVGYKWSDDITLAIRSKLAESGVDSELYIEFLDAKRFPDSPDLPTRLTMLSRIHQYRNFDLIIVVDDIGLDLLLQNSTKLFPAVPVVFCAINSYDTELISQHPEVTGVIEIADIEGTVDLALSLHPKTKKLIAICSSSHTSELLQERFADIRPRIEGKVGIEIWKDLTIEEVVEKSRRTGSDSLLMVIGALRDQAGEWVRSRPQYSALATACPAPIYSLWDFALGHGVVGGRLLNGTDQGRMAAELAIKILTGTPVSDIPVVTDSPTSAMFDYKQLQRFGIELDQLPAGSIVINKPHSFYESHRKTVLYILLVVAILAVMVIALSINIIRRIRAEKKLEKYLVELEHLVEDRTVELTDSNERFRVLAEASFECVVVSVDGTIIEANSAMADMFGYELPELLGMQAVNLVDPTCREEVGKMIMSGYEKQYETIGLRKNGVGFPMEVQARMFSYGGREVRGTAIRDLTERRKAEEEIQVLRGILPICSSCKRIRDDEGSWRQLEVYIDQHSEATFSHGICQECIRKLYPDLLDEDGNL